eukprot:2904638-Pleurochrysis_carterae.AAC.1
MNVRRTSCRVYSGVGQEIREASGEELTRVVGVECTYKSLWFRLVLIEQRSEGGEELTHVQGGFGLRPHWVRGFESRVIVNEDQDILVPAVPRASERSGNVGVHQTARVGWLVKFVRVRQLGRIGLTACRAPVESAG